MHFKPFWMPCLHIKFFTSAPIPELTAVENFTKRWNGMLGSLSDFKNQFKSRKVLIRLEWNPSIRNEEKKVLIGSEFMFQEGAKLSKYRFFMLLLLRILVRNKTYMLSDWIFLKNILIGQISSHRCRSMTPSIWLAVTLGIIIFIFQTMGCVLHISQEQNACQAGRP